MQLFGLMVHEECKYFEDTVYNNVTDIMKYLKNKLIIERSSFMEKWAILKNLEEGKKYFKIADTMDKDFKIESEYYLVVIDIGESV